MRFTRVRYQEGSLTTERRKNNSVWIYRWRTEEQGRSIQRKRIIGTLKQYRSKREARKAVEELSLNVNASATDVRGSITVSRLAAHYANTEMKSTRLAASTCRVYQGFITSYILPEWGDRLLSDVKAVSVEHWLTGLRLSPGTKGKVRNIFSTLFQHAKRQEWAEVNPIRDVRQSTKRLREPDILLPSETQAILQGLSGAAYIAVLLAATLGLRRSEIAGLQWQDVDAENALLNLRRGVVNQQISALKTAGSKRALPIPDAVLAALTQWKVETPFNKPEDWVFASANTEGKQPIWLNSLLERVILPMVRKLGITKCVGWHTFRRSFATLLYSSEENVKTTQELMRHSTPTVTMGVYAQAVTTEKRQAQNKIAELLLS